MPKRGAFALALTALALVLLLNFRTPAATTAVAGSGSRTAGGTTTHGTPAGAAHAADTRTVSGPVVNTRFGAVQVQVTVTGSRITDVTALQLPDGDNRSAMISSRAEPVLRSEALQAQGASIDGVTGATYTSDAYARSLQAALDSAGI
jgi:uncharacterized protein with FMN-binding domain